jgi:2-dehydro-3-deoxyphosphogluconate aldolase / (4S)-4-hydroxy-2-oxoglutarate aldolase
MNSENNILFPKKLITALGQTGIMAVIEIEEIKHAIPLAKALIKGGVNAIELTLRTPVALEAAKLIINEVPLMTVGLGTVLSIEQAESASRIGAAFAVAPGCNPKIIQAAKANGLPFAPGIVTPSDIESAIENGCRILKFFPAETSGGLSHLKSMAAPYKYLGLKFIPLGGLNNNNIQSYLQSDLILALGGSWIAKRDMIKEEKWDLITENANQVRKIIIDIKRSNLK